MCHQVTYTVAITVLIVIPMGKENELASFISTQCKSLQKLRLLSRVGNIVEPMNDQVKLYLQGETEF